MKNEFQDDQRKQLEIISRDINILQSNLTATTNTLAKKIDLVDRKLNSTQEKQLKLTSNLRDHGHGNKQRLDQLMLHVKNFANDFKLIDQQMETVHQKQNELSRSGIKNEQKINAVRTNLTENIHRLEEKLTSDIQNHGHGNKHRIDQLASQIKSQDVIDQKMNLTLTNITVYMNQIQRQAFENITILSSEMNITTKKVGSLWINFLDGKNLISPLLPKYGSRNYAEYIRVKESIDEELERFDIYEAEYKRIVTDRIPNTFSLKLHQVESNLKKVKITFTLHPFESNNLYFD